MTEDDVSATGFLVRARRRARLRLTLIGYWEGESAPGWPRVTDFVDEHWDESERDSAARYLQQGLRAPWRSAGPSRCRFCSKANGSNEKTDGVYLWPDGLAHYLRDHGVRPPISVTRHILRGQSIMHKPREDYDWWKEMRREPRSVLVHRDWWKKATLSS